jgi:hypothetical protein
MIPLLEIFTNDMGSMHAYVYEFIMHRKGDIDLSLFSFSYICRLKDQELTRTSYMKDVVLYEWIATKFTSYFLSYSLFVMDFQIYKWTSTIMKTRGVYHRCSGAAAQMSSIAASPTFEGPGHCVDGKGAQSTG